MRESKTLLDSEFYAVVEFWIPVKLVFHIPTPKIPDYTSKISQIPDSQAKISQRGQRCVVWLWSRLMSGGYSGFQVTGMIEWGLKLQPQQNLKKIPGPKFNKKKIPCQISEP